MIKCQPFCGSALLKSTYTEEGTIYKEKKANKAAEDTVNIAWQKSLLKCVFSLFYTNPLFHLVLPKKVDGFLSKKCNIDSRTHFPAATTCYWLPVTP